MVMYYGTLGAPQFTNLWENSCEPVLKRTTNRIRSSLQCYTKYVTTVCGIIRVFKCPINIY